MPDRTPKQVWDCQSRPGLDDARPQPGLSGAERSEVVDDGSVRFCGPVTEESEC